MKHPKRDQVAALLRAGASYGQIRAQLHVGNPTIIRVRQAIGMSPVRRGPRPKSDDERRAATLRRHPEAVAMLRDGASYRQVRAALGLAPETISSIRKTLNIPVPEHPRPARTPAEALALYSRPHTDGHTHWTGPHSGRGVPELWADGRSYSTLRVAFHLHHGRHPDGPISRNCDDRHCIAGLHLTDRTIREATRRADQAFEQIFGSAP